MRRIPTSLVIALVALWVVAMIPSPAAGGGGTRLEWDRSYYAVGDVATGRVAAWNWEGAGTVADGPYRTYLVPTQDLKERPGVPKGAVEVGPASVTNGSNGRIAVSTSFKIPDVASGMWFVRVCNAGCRLMPGDLYDSGISIGADATEVAWMQRFDRLERQMGQMVEASRFRETRTQVETITKRLDGAIASAGGADERIAHLERNTFEAVPWLLWLTVIVGVLTIVFAITALRLRRLLKRLLNDPIVALHAQLAPDVTEDAPRQPATAR